MSAIKNLIVFGAHGKVGQNLIKIVAKSSVKATAVVRSDEQASAIKDISSSSSNITTTKLDIADASVSDLTSAIKGHDAVILTVGSGGKNLLQVDLDGVVKAFEATVEAKVRRLILVSALFADYREAGIRSGIRNYYIAKHYADRILIDEFGQKLDYTIVKPTSLTDESPTGKIRVLKSISEDRGTIPRADVAQALFDILSFKDTFGKSFNIASGDKSIGDPQTYQ
ncbi:hypothetical protein KGF57_004273 [Candida theae]|uniref:NAD(P)-binding domain-containing protein n=1 Tax=Candida theae TaxID=1198502 RepID=A0AAD5BBH4_9ASCO|nr:uncharacterized protein KGF57_004273 [Candida theae]KAI5950667.1 hypothetical protein KGF57_004273 [Candida theae]